VITGGDPISEALGHDDQLAHELEHERERLFCVVTEPAPTGLLGSDGVGDSNSRRVTGNGSASPASGNGAGA
jgi:hypothetical protein